ncbi:glutathione S-transferase family protein [Shimia marina]|uniref:glutathione S-transferase family protein n=1 Tax=Shimia marina TaxID=321267 RepID=UPI0008E1A059|nr:glutathione S-transferase family protein [Shimia marina]SFE30887.1 glutathione S-transferase [Shimia marina]
MTERPTLFWISGSTPAWRVMLALTLKGVVFESRRLDTGKDENRQAQYLALNPKGQVPTLVWGDVVIRESLAILGWLDRAFPARPIWGQDAAEAASVWQDVALLIEDLHPHLSEVGLGLMRREVIAKEAITALEAETDAWCVRLEASNYLGGTAPMASDIWLYPALYWIGRGVALNANPPVSLTDFITSRPALAAWRARMAALPGVADTYPPHWRTS